MEADEAKTACEAGDGVAEAFGWGATNEEVLFVFRDEGDVFFDVALGQVGSSFLGECGLVLVPLWTLSLPPGRRDAGCCWRVECRFLLLEEGFAQSLGSSRNGDNFEIFGIDDGAVRIF